MISGKLPVREHKDTIIPLHLVTFTLIPERSEFKFVDVAIRLEVCLMFEHIILLELILNVLRLVDEDPIILLLNLKSKKILQRTHHTHLKFHVHTLKNILTKGFISRTEYDIINIHLY